MKIYKEQNLSGFEFWSGAVHNAERLTAEELDTLEYFLEDCYPEGMSETEVNDLLWFEFETVCEWLEIEYNPETDEITRN